MNEQQRPFSNHQEKAISLLKPTGQEGRHHVGANLAGVQGGDADGNCELIKRQTWKNSDQSNTLSTSRDLALKEHPSTEIKPSDWRVIWKLCLATV